MLARRFLGCITFLVLLAVAGAFLFFQFGDRLLTKAVTPQGHFVASAADDGPDYNALANWLARPSDGISLADWRPDQADGTPAPPPTLQPKAAATFFVHPTTYLDTDRWNAPLQPGGETEKRSQLFVRSQASAFNEVSTVWAPRYRQAAFGAFLLQSADARKALDLAYGDVSRAFDAFLAANPTGPLILAGHSQGSLHLLRLLADRKDALKGRLVAAYVGGWPVGITADLPATGLPACRTAEQSGCVLSWQTFSTPANPALVLNSWVGTKGLAGPARTRADMLCVDPVSGTINGASPASAHPGMLVPNADFSKATLARGRLATRCDDGFLTVEGELPDLGNFALPGNNLHPYDYALFWSALRADVDRRAAAFGGAMIYAAAADFAEGLGASGGRLGGLDVGTKTVGLATCDSGWSFATPAGVLKRTKFTADLEALRRFVAAHGLKGLVLGLPLNMDGSDSPRTQSVRAFARNLAPLDLPILMWDERWSTVAVERAMIEADMSRAKRADKVDAHAAAHILQGAIDALVNLPPHG